MLETSKTSTNPPSNMTTAPSPSTDNPQTPRPLSPPSLLTAAQKQLTENIMSLDRLMKELSHEGNVILDALIDFAGEDEVITEFKKRHREVTSELSECEKEKRPLVQQLTREMSRLEVLAGCGEKRDNRAERQLRVIQDTVRDVTFGAEDGGWGDGS